jgi:hypothetical protein
MMLRLEVREDNVRAIRLYEQNGYRRIGCEPDYYEDGMTALALRKDLARRRACGNQSAVLRPDLRFHLRPVLPDDGDGQFRPQVRARSGDGNPPVARGDDRSS